MDPMELFRSIKERLEAMQPEIADWEQKTTQQIPELWQQLAPSTDRETCRPGPDDRSHVSHLARISDDSPFIDPNTQNYVKAERTLESTSVSETGNEYHTQEMGYRLSREGHIETIGPAWKKLGPPPWVKPWHGKAGARAGKLQSSQQMRRGSQDETRLPADRQEVTGGTAVKQTTIPSDDGKQTNSSKLNNIQTQNPFKERSNMTP